MVDVKDLINSNDIIDMIHEASGKKWSLSYFNIKKNFKDFPDPIYHSGKIYLWHRTDISKYVKQTVPSN